MLGNYAQSESRIRWLAAHMTPRPASLREDGPEEVFIDASRLTCPMPVLKLRMALSRIKPGGFVKVRTTDPGARRDFANFCRSTGNDLVRVEGAGNALDFCVKKN